MKQLVLLSGKGGTGKTTLSSAFIKRGKTRVFADCDIDAPNLHLALNIENGGLIQPFYGMPKAIVNELKCKRCNVCTDVCQFEAISNGVVSPYMCEGCSVCQLVCPNDAIQMVPNHTGDVISYVTDQYNFTTGLLKIGQGNSGKLVSSVKRKLYTHFEEKLIIVDGSPGIGCPVIASISGANFVLLVTEPTESGIRDLKRISETVRRFNVPQGVCINKADVNPIAADAIRAYCHNHRIEIIGEIPFNSEVARYQNQGMTILDLEVPEILDSMERVYQNTMEAMGIL